jgi:hypothetical protein
MNLDLDDEERAALVELLRVTIENDRYPMSARVRSLRSIRAKLEGRATGEARSKPSNAKRSR